MRHSATRKLISSVNMCHELPIITVIVGANISRTDFHILSGRSKTIPAKPVPPESPAAVASCALLGLLSVCLTIFLLTGAIVGLLQYLRNRLNIFFPQIACIYCKFARPNTQAQLV